MEWFCASENKREFHAFRIQARIASKTKTILTKSSEEREREKKIDFETYGTGACGFRFVVFHIVHTSMQSLGST